MATVLRTIVAIFLRTVADNVFCYGTKNRPITIKENKLETTFTVKEPAAIFRCGLLEVCTKLIVAFDEATEYIPEIDGYNRIDVYTSLSTEKYRTDSGFPLRFVCNMSKPHFARLANHWFFFINDETNEALAQSDNVTESEEFRGDIDVVVKTFSAYLLKWFQDKFDSVSG